MSLQTLYTTLTDHAGLAGLVASRIYRGRIPQHPTYPLILYRVFREPVNDLSGESDLKNYSVEFELYGRDYGQLSLVESELKACLTNSQIVSSVCTGIADDDFQDDHGVYSVFVDFSIWFQQGG